VRRALRRKPLRHKCTEGAGVWVRNGTPSGSKGVWDWGKARGRSQMTEVQPARLVPSSVTQFHQGSKAKAMSKAKVLNSHLLPAAQWMGAALPGRVLLGWGGRVEIVVGSAECFPALHFVRSCLPKSKWCPQPRQMLWLSSQGKKERVVGLTDVIK
jgi:hypothetical protein